MSLEGDHEAIEKAGVAPSGDPTSNGTQDATAVGRGTFRTRRAKGAVTSALRNCSSATARRSFTLAEAFSSIAKQRKAPPRLTTRAANRSWGLVGHRVRQYTVRHPGLGRYELGSIMRTLPLFLIAFLFTVSVSSADIIYQAIVNTSTISGTTGSLDFNLSRGNLAGSPQLTGDDLDGSTTVPTSRRRASGMTVQRRAAVIGENG